MLCILTVGLTTCELADDLAWDWINEKLYWTNPDNKTIEVYDPSTGYRRVLVEVDQGSLPRAIVVDPSMG